MMHHETPYKTIQRTKYIVQVVVCKLAAMFEKIVQEHISVILANVSLGRYNMTL